MIFTSQNTSPPLCCTFARTRTSASFYLLAISSMLLGRPSPAIGAAPVGAFGLLAAEAPTGFRAGYALRDLLLRYGRIPLLARPHWGLLPTQRRTARSIWLVSTIVRFTCNFGPCGWRSALWVSFCARHRSIPSIGCSGFAYFFLRDFFYFKLLFWRSTRRYVATKFYEIKT